MKPTFRLKSDKFSRALADYGVASRKCADEVVREAGRRFVAAVQKRTPPMKGGVSPAKGRRDALARYKARIIGAGMKNHSRRMNQIEGTRARQRYFREAKRLLGTLASGWNAAAEFFGKNKMPNWIRGKGTSHGSVKFSSSLKGDEARAVISNCAPRVGRTDLSWQVPYALNEVRKGLLKSMKAILKRRMK